VSAAEAVPRSSSAAVGTAVVAEPAEAEEQQRMCSSSDSWAVPHHRHRRKTVASVQVGSNTRSNEAAGDNLQRYCYSPLSTPRTRDRFFLATTQCPRLLCR
jgi:hypothetical protein